MPNLVDDLSLEFPLFQSPMAGVSTPQLAAGASNGGALGALGLGAASVEAAAKAVADLRQATEKPFNLNFFCHKPAELDEGVALDWIARSAPLFEEFDASPPTELREIYQSFVENDAMFRFLLESKPAVASFHFGLPTSGQVAALKAAGIRLVASATSLQESRQVERAGLDAVVAQGWEAGGHRGLFDENGSDERLETQALTRLLSKELSLPIIAAGGLMDGRDIARAISWGAAAAQLGTAFVGCPESSADDGFRARLAKDGETIMTRAISGRPARGLKNRFTAWGEGVEPGDVPAYPNSYDLGKALNAAAKAKGESGFGAQWAGTGAERARALPVAELMIELKREYAAQQVA